MALDRQIAITKTPPGRGTYCVRLMTRELALYGQAADAEGTTQRFDAQWHQGRTADGRRCQVLDGLEALASKGMVS